MNRESYLEPEKGLDTVCSVQSSFMYLTVFTLLQQMNPVFPNHLERI